jgi:succinyl-CoA synthetase alpha subunit
MSILIDRNSRVMTQGITGNTGQFHTRTSRDYANGRACFVAGVPCATQRNRPAPPCR